MQDFHKKNILFSSELLDNLETWKIQASKLKTRPIKVY